MHHATNEGVCSWVDFAEAIFVAVGKQVQLQWAAARNTVQSPTPKNSRMSKEKLSKQDFRRLPPWQDALGRYLKEIDDSSK